MSEVKGSLNDELWTELGKQITKVFEKEENESDSRINYVLDRIENILNQNNKEWLTNHEAMEYLNIEPSTFYNWRKQGLKVSPIGRKIYVRQTEINRFLQEREI